MSRIVAHMALALLALLAAGATGAQADSGKPTDAARSFSIGPREVAGYRLISAGGAPVDYFISKPAQRAALVLYIQGSGCTPVFIGLGTPNRSSTLFSFIPLAVEGKYAVMAVNKPYSSAAQSGNQGAATDCPAEFNAYFSLDNWVRDLRLAIDHAAALPWVDMRQVLVTGTSEGATVAAALAAQEPRITHVALMSGSGATQLYDFVVAAYKAPGSDEEVKRRLMEIEATRKLIAAAPDSATAFAWGHPYRRWSGFFRASSSNNLLKSRARVYIVSGMQDVNVPILSTEVMASELAVAGRDVTMRRIPQAGHSLLLPGAQYSELQAEYDRVMKWFGGAGY